MGFRFTWALVLAALSGLCAGQVVLNQVDTFQDGTTMSWAGGSSPTHVPSGGPAGSGDGYLQISSTNFHLATFNLVRWSGNYLAAGVDRIEADLRNTGPNPLAIRLVLFASSTDRWSSNAVANLPPNSAWTRVSFDLVESNFTHTLGTSTFPGMMSGMERIMLRHEPVPSANGPFVTGTLGIDNVSGFALANSLPAEAFAVIIGLPGSGGLSDLQSSDDSRLFVRQDPFRSRQDPAVRVEFSATAPPGSFGELEFVLEASTNAVPASSVSQRIELWNFTTSQWDLVDSRPASATDQTAVISITSGVANYIHSGNRALRARASYFDPGTLLTRSWSVGFDLSKWTLTR
jgi:hypothetical protein